MPARFHHHLPRVAPILFVLMWSTGFIGAKFGLPYAEPMTLLALRMVITLVILTALAFAFSARVPPLKGGVYSVVVGMLIHGCYLGGIFSAIKLGMPSGLAALIAGLQPLLAAVLATLWFKDRLRVVQWCGLGLGLLGVVLVLSGRISLEGAEGFGGWPALVFAVMALAGITLGAMIQKRHCTGVDLVSGTILQYLGALAIFAPGAFLFETRMIDWTPTLIGALAWLVGVLSIGAILLLMYLVRQGEAAKVASLFYLVPPVTALEAWILFDEQLGWAGAAGIVLAAVGVYLVIRKPGPLRAWWATRASPPQ